MAQRLDLDSKSVGITLAQTLCQKATEAELVAFCIVANDHGLNPFKKELYCIPKKGGGLIPYVPIDGWTNIVNRQPDYNGCEFEEHDDAEGKLWATTCTIHVKSRDYPTKVTERLSECVRPGDNWKNMPARMLRHKAFMQCARIAFSLSGIFDQDEAQDQADRAQREAAPDAPRQIVDAEVEVPPDATPAQGDEGMYPEGDLITEKQRVRLMAIAHKSGITNAALKAHAFKKYGLDSSKLITCDIYEELCDWASAPQGGE